MALESKIWSSWQEAALSAIAEIAREGGGTMVIHKPDCLLYEEDGCPCGPEEIEVTGAN